MRWRHVRRELLAADCARLHQRRSHAVHKRLTYCNWFDAPVDSPKLRRSPRDASSNPYSSAHVAADGAGGGGAAAGGAGAVPSVWQGKRPGGSVSPSMLTPTLSKLSGMADGLT